MTIEVEPPKAGETALQFRSGPLYAESDTFRLKLSEERSIWVNRETALFLFNNGEKAEHLVRLLRTLNPGASAVEKLIEGLAASPDAVLGELARLSAARPVPSVVGLYKDMEKALVLSNGVNAYSIYCDDLRTTALEPEVWVSTVDIACTLDFDAISENREKLFKLFTQARHVSDKLFREQWDFLIARMLRGNERRLMSFLASVPSSASRTTIRHAFDLLAKKGYAAATDYMDGVASSSHHLSAFRKECEEFMAKLKEHGMEFDDGILLPGYYWRSGFYFVSGMGAISTFSVSPLKFYSVWKKGEAELRDLIYKEGRTDAVGDYDVRRVKDMLVKVKPEFLLLLDK